MTSPPYSDKVSSNTAKNNGNLSAIHHPKHYNFGKIEVIDVIEDWELNFSRACIIKYVARASHKGSEIEDLRKAKWYLEREIGRLETSSDGQ